MATRMREFQLLVQTTTSGDILYCFKCKSAELTNCLDLPKKRDKYSMVSLTAKKMFDMNPQLRFCNY